MTTLCTRTTALRIVSSLFPDGWQGRAAIVEQARRLDAQHGGDGSLALLDAWRWWRTTEALPASGAARDLVSALSELLGGVGCELRRTPREPRT